MSDQNIQGSTHFEDLQILETPPPKQLDPDLLTNPSDTSRKRDLKNKVKQQQLIIYNNDEELKTTQQKTIELSKLLDEKEKEYLTLQEKH